MPGHESQHPPHAGPTPGFSLALRDFRSGWVDVVLRLAGQKFDFSASSVANDTLRELAHVAGFLASDVRGSCGAVFWLEPAGFELRALRGDEVRLELHESEHAFATLFEPRLVCVAPIDETSAARAILRALDAVRGEVDAGVATGAWHHEYPVKIVERSWFALNARSE